MVKYVRGMLYCYCHCDLDSPLSKSRALRSQYTPVDLCLSQCFSNLFKNMMVFFTYRLLTIRICSHNTLGNTNLTIQYLWNSNLSLNLRVLLLWEPVWEGLLGLPHSVFVLNPFHPCLAESVLYLRFILNPHTPKFFLTSPSKAWKPHPLHLI